MVRSVNIMELSLPQPEVLKSSWTKSSMYVPGKLHAVEHVVIDVGSDFYVEKSADDTKDFFKRKIDFLTKQMERIHLTLKEKHAIKQAIMEMMSQKIQQLTALGVSHAGEAKA
ncbi:prefoldin subunit 5-like [Notamacropus eugenii]|uniref:prefoldin subunit 5-like n=1 Tax=Notamacropus eugenii TaxID=9315 RepID=UPI003B6758BC